MAIPGIGEGLSIEIGKWATEKTRSAPFRYAYFGTAALCSADVLRYTGHRCQKDLSGWLAADAEPSAPAARRKRKVDHPAEDVSTDLVDLTEISFEDLPGCDDAIFARSLTRFLRQIQRPRVNVGSGPDGARFD
jgi:hypothetical protein